MSGVVRLLLGGHAHDLGLTLRRDDWLAPPPRSVPDDRPHSDLTRSILESAMRVQSVLGVGLLEKAYKVCLAHALRQKGHRVLVEVHLDITFEGLLIPRFIPD